MRHALHGQVRGQPVRLFGTEFFWPMQTDNPHYRSIPDDCDILISHGLWAHVGVVSPEGRKGLGQRRGSGLLPLHRNLQPPTSAAAAHVLRP